MVVNFFFFSSRRRHTRWNCDWSSDVCSSDLQKARRMLGPERSELLREAASRLEAIEDWTAGEIERVLRALQEDSGLSPKLAFQPIRAAVTGTLVSPPLFESIALLGKDRTLERLRAAVASASVG